MEVLFSLTVISAALLPALVNSVEYASVQPYQPSYPSYNPPPYYETIETNVDYKEANQTKRCGVLPAVHCQFGLHKDKVDFGQYPWQVGILDDYYNYLCGGALITPRHVITSSYCVDKLTEDKIRVRVGEWDLSSDKNYLEVLKNTEVKVCKKHPYYNVPYDNTYKKNYQADQYAAYAVVILELSNDVDFDLLPHVEPVCLPEFYYLTKAYTDSYTGYSYGYGQQSSAASNNQVKIKNEEGANKDLTCWVLGYQNSPLEKFEYQQQQQQSYQPQQYGYSSYSPPPYYPSYEYSRTPRRAKVHKVESYPSYYPPASSYAPQYKTENWEADYYYDACHADVGSPIFCLVQSKYEDEHPRPQYPESYPPSYQPPAYTPPAYSPPAYSPPSYSPPSYSPPSYSPPAYSPPAYSPPAYSPPSYQPEYPKYKRAAPYYPSYSPPAYSPPAYSPPAYSPPAYSPPAYAPVYQEPEYKAPIKAAEPLNEETRRAALFGIVQYPPECSYGSNSEPKKLTATPIEDILPWIQSVTRTPPSCSYTPSYSY